MNYARAAKSYSITILPQGERLEAKEKEENLLRFLMDHGYRVPSVCGGMGTCGKCHVLLRQGERLSTESERNYLSQQELDQGRRLACQQRIDRNLTVEVPKTDATALAKETLTRQLHITLNTGIEKIFLELPKPGRNDQRSDTVRIQEELGMKNLTFPLSILRKVPHVLQKGDFKLTITKEDDRGLDFEPGNTTQACYGLAIDIGTTTLAGYLLDLITGRELAACSQMNPQQSCGADVISRINWVYEYGEVGLKELQTAVISGINGMIGQLCEAVKINPTQIYKVTVAGNPTMIHLFLGIDPSNIGHSPYIPVLRDRLTLSAKELELKINPEGRTYILPAISGYVGADITAGGLFTGLHQSSRLCLFVDIGTNAEIVLGNSEKLLTCSTPAGPAFEGARIRYGMNATSGAIAHATLDEDELRLKIIGNRAPKGICGSGLIDLVAELVRVGLINEKGNLLAQSKLPHAERVTRGEKSRPQFLVSNKTEPIYLTQQDIRELQLAKGAIRSGVELILREWGITPNEIDEVYLAGAFGSYVRRESVLQIGMLPISLVKKIRPVGNAAGQGAKLALLNRGKWAEVQQLTELVEYFELAHCEGFNRLFIENMYFPARPISGQEL